MSDHYNFGQTGIKLTKSDMLFIRACKTLDPMTRLFTLRNRLYLREDDVAQATAHIGTILIDLCEKLNLISLGRLVTEMRDVNSKLAMSHRISGTEAIPYKDVNGCILGASMYAIRFASSKELANFVPMKRFRK